MGDKKLKIAVLGPLGTYTHEASEFTNASNNQTDLAFYKAAFKRFGNDFVYDEQPSISGKCNSLILFYLKNVFVAIVNSCRRIQSIELEGSYRGCTSREFHLRKCYRDI